MLCCIEGRATTTLGSAALCSPIVYQVGASNVGEPCSDGATEKKGLTCVHDIEAILNDVTQRWPYIFIDSSHVRTHARWSVHFTVRSRTCVPIQLGRSQAGAATKPVQGDAKYT